ncbi:endonuclease MutS2, partial [Thermococcus sp.]
MTLRLNPEARAVHKGILGEIRRRLILSGSEFYLELFSPTNDVDEIQRRQNYLREGLSKVRPEMKGLISKVKPIKFKREFLSDRVILVDESEVEQAEALNLCHVTTDSDEAREYPIVLSTTGYGIDVELKPQDVAPELYVIPLWENRETLEALAELGRIIGKESVAEKILNALGEFESVNARGQLLENLDEMIAEKEHWLNERISEKLENFSLTLSGKELLNFLAQLREGNYEAIFSHFTGIEEGIIELVNEAERELSDALGFTVELFQRDELYPIRVPPERVEELRQFLERELALERYLKAREIVEKIGPLIPELKKELENIHELDFLLAVKEFTEGFTFPEVWDGGVAFTRGRHLFIENPQPVSYVVGRKPPEFAVPGSENVGDEDVVILTGANSGGKTSLLELITQVEILFHMGFPVPAERAWVEPLDELFFFRR